MKTNLHGPATTLVHDFFTAMETGQTAALAALAHPDIECQMMSTPSISFEGIEKVGDSIRGWRQNFDELKITINNFIADDKLVFVESTTTGRHKALGKPLKVPSCDVFELGADGKIALWRTYWPTELAKQQLGITGNSDDRQAAA